MPTFFPTQGDHSPAPDVNMYFLVKPCSSLPVARQVGPTAAAALNRVVIRLSTEVRSMLLLSAVKHDGYYFLTLWTEGDSSLCLCGDTAQQRVVNCQSPPVFALVFLVKRCHTEPPSTWCLFISLHSTKSLSLSEFFIFVLWCKRRKGGRRCKSETRNYINCVFALMSLESTLLTVKELKEVEKTR